MTDEGQYRLMAGYVCNQHLSYHHLFIPSLTTGYVLENRRITSSETVKQYLRTQFEARFPCLYFSYRLGYEEKLQL